MSAEAGGSQRREIELKVNGQSICREVDVRLTVVDFLRHELGLTGTHVGCEHGVCGACTVLLDGRAVRGCLTLAVQTVGREIRTVESLAEGGRLHPLQAAFHDQHGLQCGYCTAGILMTLVDFLVENPAPEEAELKKALSGNLCRCTGYQNIIAAAMDGAARLRGEESSNDDLHR